MTQLVELKVPDIGDFDQVEVIEVLVSEGDTIETEQSLITVESDKASMEIPAEQGGVVKSLKIKVGDKVAEGSVILEIEPAAEAAKGGEAQAKAEPAQDAAGDNNAEASPEAKADTSQANAGGDDAQEEAAADSGARRQAEPPPAAESTAPAGQAARTAPVPPVDSDGSAPKPHASPSVRKFARELGVDLYKVRGSGAKQRITHDDVRAFVKALNQAASGAAAPAAQGAGAGGAGLGLLPWPKVDFEKYGPIERKDLSRIQKISGANLHRNWVMIPHVTNNDEADITELEALRQELNRENEKAGIKVTMLAFLIKAVVASLKKYPQFNASLDGETLVFKQYFHIGFAADTPNGLVVPVIRDADRKGVLELAQETAALAKKARDGKLSPGEMQGGCFSISSLGGIGGTHFTPIINAPEVAILGVSRSYQKPVWNGDAFIPRLTLPLSLSYDHRVIDGALAARFNAHLASLLADFRRIAL
ncbi:MAG: dihydrolipoyllysine-residue acetyltransferase [Pigmentiphaga sp.]|nr:dihydrolipoyllysine-residue acetyltransferase [Pigmentiphaga sp.]